MCIIEKHIENFYKTVQNAETITVQEDQIHVMKIRIKYEINKK